MWRTVAQKLPCLPVIVERPLFRALNASDNLMTFVVHTLPPTCCDVASLARARKKRPALLAAQEEAADTFGHIRRRAWSSWFA